MIRRWQRLTGYRVEVLSRGKCEWVDGVSYTEDNDDDILHHKPEGRIRFVRSTRACSLTLLALMLNPITTLIVLVLQKTEAVCFLVVVYFVAETVLKAVKQRAEQAHYDQQALLFFAIAQSFVPQD